MTNRRSFLTGLAAALAAGPAAVKAAFADSGFFVTSRSGQAGHVCIGIGDAQAAEAQIVNGFSGARYLLRCTYEEVGDHYVLVVGNQKMIVTRRKDIDYVKG